MEAVEIRAVESPSGQWRADVYSLHDDRYSHLHGTGSTKTRALMRLHDQLVNLCEVVLMKIAEPLDAETT